MKQSDIALIIIVVAISLTTSYFVGNAVFNSPDKRTAEVEVVRRVSETFPTIDATIFNEDKAINLTEDVKAGGSNPDNPEPFQNNE